MVQNGQSFKNISFLLLLDSLLPTITLTGYHLRSAAGPAAAVAVAAGCFVAGTRVPRHNHRGYDRDGAAALYGLDHQRAHAPRTKIVGGRRQGSARSEFISIKFNILQLKCIPPEFLSGFLVSSTIMHSKLYQ